MKIDEHFLDPDGGATIQVVSEQRLPRNFDKGLWLIQSQTVEPMAFSGGQNNGSTHARRIIGHGTSIR